MELFSQPNMKAILLLFALTYARAFTPTGIKSLEA